MWVLRWQYLKTCIIIYLSEIVQKGLSSILLKAQSIALHCLGANLQYDFPEYHT